MTSSAPAGESATPTGLPGALEVAPREERIEPRAVRRERLLDARPSAVLFAVDEHDRVHDRQPLFRALPDRVDERAAAGDHVFDQDHRVALFDRAFEPAARAVLLGDL